MEDMDLRKRRRSADNPAKTYRISPEAIGAVENMSLALDLPIGKVVDLAIMRLHQEWRAGRVKGVGLVVAAGSIVEE
jgi:hypothetical protein